MEIMNWRSSSWWLLLFALVSLEFWVKEATGKSEALTVELKALDLYPESFDWDAVHNRFLIGSTTAGTISAVKVDGFVEEFVRDEEYAGKVGIAGVKVDRKRNRVIATVQNFFAGDFSGVAAYDLDTRKRLYFTRLERVGVAEGEQACSNDVAVDPKGNVYVTNCIGNFLWKVTKEGTPSVFVKHVHFTTQPIIIQDKSAAWCGFNGVVYHRNGYLLVSQTNSGALFRINLVDQSVHVVIMREKLPGADGMIFRDDGTLVVVSKDKVWLVGSASDWMAANVVDTVSLNAADDVTAVAMKKRSTFILHSYISEMFAKQSREAFQVKEVIFPAEYRADDPMWLIILLVVIILVISLWRFQMGHFYEQYRRKRA